MATPPSRVGRELSERMRCALNDILTEDEVHGSDTFKMRVWRELSERISGRHRQNEVRS